MTVKPQWPENPDCWQNAAQSANAYFIILLATDVWTHCQTAAGQADAKVRLPNQIFLKRSACVLTCCPLTFAVV